MKVFNFMRSNVAHPQQVLNMSGLDFTDQATYRFCCEDNIRFADLDSYGHLNNVAFATFAETGRVEFFDKLRKFCVRGEGESWVIAKLTVNFLAAAYYPSTVTIGHVVTRIGNSSVELHQGLFVNGECFSTIESVLVWADTKAESSRPLPDDLRAELQPFFCEG